MKGITYSVIRRKKEGVGLVSFGLGSQIYFGDFQVQVVLKSNHFRQTLDRFRAFKHFCYTPSIHSKFLNIIQLKICQILDAKKQAQAAYILTLEASKKKCCANTSYLRGSIGTPFYFRHNSSE